jgi:hypothetical protein
MHLIHAKEQRAAIKTILKKSAKDILKDDKDFTLACEEFDACIEKWVCNHEVDTQSHELFLSNAEATILNEVRLII